MPNVKIEKGIQPRAYKLNGDRNKLHLLGFTLKI